MMKQTPNHYLIILLLLLLLHGIMGCQPGTQEAITPQPVDLAYSVTTHPIETPITDAEAEEAVTVVAFPGLTDTTGPTSLTSMLTQLNGIYSTSIMISRPHENEDIYVHAQRAYKALVEVHGMTNKPLLLVGESYGVLVAYAMSLYNTVRADYNLNLTSGKELNIKGLISVHGPWQGVSPVSGLLRRYQQLQSLGFNPLLKTCFQQFNISDYIIPKPLEALAPNGAFVQTIKRTLIKVDYPILALAGSNKGHYGVSAYDQFRDVCHTSSFKNKLLTFAFHRSTSSIIAEYELGNDGLITTASALAERILTNGYFTQVQAEAPHIHSDFSLYPTLVEAVSTFVQKEILATSSSSAASGSPAKAYIAFDRYVRFKGLKDAQGNPILVSMYTMVSPNA